MQYVIKKSHTWKKKNGENHTHISYFSGVLLLGGKLFAVELSDLAHAKRFETKGGARIALRKYFAASENATVEPVAENQS